MFKNHAHRVISSYKCQSKADELKMIPIYHGELVGFLRPVTAFYKVTNPEYLDLVRRWREENPVGFANVFKGTREKTECWFDNTLLPREDRILFMVYHVVGGFPIGHLGFSNFDYENETCEIDNVVRGVKNGFPGMMSMAMRTLIDWGERVFHPSAITLRVLSDNDHAIQFYKKLGFETKRYIPLYRYVRDDVVGWEELEDAGGRVPDRYFAYMQLTNQIWTEI